MTKSTIAERINAQAQHAGHAMDYAAAAAVETDQDWDAETTIYTFEDNSQLVVSGPEYWVAGTERPTEEN